MASNEKAVTVVTLIGSAFLFAGCTFTTDALWPSLSGGVPKATKKPPQKIVINSSGAKTTTLAAMRAVCPINRQNWALQILE